MAIYFAKQKSAAHPSHSRQLINIYCMTLIVSPNEIDQFRAELADYPDAITALDVLEDCEGDLEDAAITLAIRAGQQPDRSEQWLESLAKRGRPLLCRVEFRSDLVAGTLGSVMASLADKPFCPPLLLALVVIYVVKSGVGDFCQPFDTGSYEGSPIAGN